MPRLGQFLLVILDVHMRGQADLAQVVQAGDGMGADFRPGECGQKQAGEDRYDCDHHEQFD